MKNKWPLIILILGVATLTAKAQNLPNIQKISLRVPADIKIDGKATEWNNKFEAYNKATKLYYTIANDDDNLYLSIQVTDPVIITKILSGGITFIINKSGKKGDENAVSITYPIIDGKDKPNVHFRNIPQVIPGDKASVLKADSFMNDNNRRITNKFKWIRVTGIKGLDTLTSVYNREGVRVAGLFDDKMVYTYELSVDLKHLGLSINKSENFSYHMLSGGIDMYNLDGGPKLVPNANPSALPDIGSFPQGGYNFNRGDFKILISTTDFWGEYT